MIDLAPVKALVDRRVRKLDNWLWVISGCVGGCLASIAVVLIMRDDFPLLLALWVLTTVLVLLYMTIDSIHKEACADLDAAYEERLKAHKNKDI